MTILNAEKKGSALLLTMNRPEALNALSSALVLELQAAVEAAAQRRDIRGIVITGAGDKAFSAGTDLKERRTLDDERRAAQSRSLLTLSRSIRDNPKPVIAAIGGWCLGGGFELALACDVRIAAEDARFAFPEMALGAYPGSGGAATLPRIVGIARAKEILFTARRLDAAEALRLGLVERLVARPALIDSALAWVEEMEATSPLALAALKRSMHEGMTLSVEEASELDQSIRRRLDATADYQEGLRAYFEKRKPVFRGE